MYVLSRTLTAGLMQMKRMDRLHVIIDIVGAAAAAADDKAASRIAPHDLPPCSEFDHEMSPWSDLPLELLATYDVQSAKQYLSFPTSKDICTVHLHRVHYYSVVVS